MCLHGTAWKVMDFHDDLMLSSLTDLMVAEPKGSRLLIP
jgi:hypothetical protein